MINCKRLWTLMYKHLPFNALLFLREKINEAKCKIVDGTRKIVYI